MRSTLGIAVHVLMADIARSNGDLDRAIAELERAVEMEDGMSYMEPPYWHQPVRSMLGDVLHEAGRRDDAIAVYRADLRRFPRNVLSTRGLERVSAVGAGKP